MVVAVVAVGVVEMAIDQIVDMVAVGHSFVPAARAMLVRAVVATAAVVWGAGCRIVCIDTQCMFVGVPVVRVMQMTVVQIVDMAIVFHRGMATIGAMGMVVVGVGVAFVAVGHDSFLGCCITRKRARKVG